MAFPRKLLNDSEEIVLDLHPHWSYFLKQGFALVVSLLVLAVTLALFDPPNPVVIILLVLVAAAVVWFLLRLLVWRSINFALTTDRLIYRTGVIAKHGTEIPLERLNDISFHQSILERMFRTGDLLLESAGERGQQHFTDIPRPSLVQNEIYRQIEANKNRDADRMAGRRSELSVPEQLEKLDELRQRGVISPAEFEAKKQQLLDRM